MTTPKTIMVASTLFLGAAGLTASFGPAELLAALNAPTTLPLLVLVQLLGAAYLGFAFANWTAKDNMIGGIYARPLSLGNFLHFGSGALALLKYALAHGFGGLTAVMTVALVGYAVFAAAFGYLVFGPGLPIPPPSSR